MTSKASESGSAAGGRVRRRCHHRLLPSERHVRVSPHAAQADWPAVKQAARKIRKRRLWTVRSACFQSIWCQAVRGEPRSFGAASGPTVRTVFPMAFLPSLPTRPVGSQHPFRLGLSTREGWPYPSDYRRAFASSHILYPLGIGLPCGRLSRLDRQPMGFTVFRQQEMQTP